LNDEKERLEEIMKIIIKWEQICSHF
jgi:hypothetical protein